MAKITIVGNVPKELVQEFSQLIRDFEQRDPVMIKLGMVVDGQQDMTDEEIEQVVFGITPSFPFVHKSTKQ